MKRYLVISLTLAACGCSSSNGTSDGGPGGPSDAATNDGSADDSSTPGVDSTPPDSGPAPDSGTGDSSAADSGSSGDTGTGDSAVACPSSWLVPPGVDPSLALPDGGGGVLLHASASGTQDYTCTQATGDAGTVYAWTFVGPEANLSDCNAAPIGHHFASDGGATAPEWQTTDGTFVIGHKLAAFTPDGGAASVPWLLLQGVAHGGTGTLSNARYIQRLDTDGGVAPTTACDPNSVGMTDKVPYGADYYFFGP
jgi:hypothetical protein